MNMIISLDRYKKNSGGSGGIIPSGTISITENGSYNVYNYASANVDIQSGGTANTYSYFDGSIDDNGLRYIGWDDESIGYFKDNCVNWYGWDNDSYKVSSGNKSIYDRLSTIYRPSLSAIQEYRYNENFRFCPMTRIPQAYDLFEQFYYLEYIPKLDTSTFSDFELMFYDCWKLQTIPKLDTSNATTMRNMFTQCYSLKSVPALDTSNVESMYCMFNECNKLETVPLFNTSNVTNMYGMFLNCSNLKSVPLFDTSKVTNMSYTLSGCSKLETVPLFNTSNVESMYCMFYGCRNLKSVPLFDTSKVTSMRYMFHDCGVLNSVPLFNTSNVYDMSRMFDGCISLNSVPSFNTSQVTTIDGIFNNCSNLTRIDGIDLSSVSSSIELSYYWESHPPLEHIVFNGYLNPDFIRLDYYHSLDDESIMSALKAASRTTDDLKSKELFLPNKTYLGNDNVPEGLVDLVNECTSKNWSITGLTIITDEDLENVGNPDEAIPVTLQEFVEAEPDTGQWYRLTVTLYNCPKMESGIWTISEEGFEPPVWFEHNPVVLINGLTNDGLKFAYDYWSWSEFPGDGSTITILTQKHYAEEDTEIGTEDGWSITIPAGATFGGKYTGSPLAIYVE